MRRRMIVGLLALAAVAVPQTAMPAQGATPPERGQVTSGLHLPTSSVEATRLGRDLDGDNSRDNQLGQVFAALVGQGLDFGAAHDAAIMTGDIVMLHSLRTASLANTRNASWQVLYAPPTADPDLSGAGSFEVAADQPRSARLDARIKDHVVRTVAGRIPVRLDIGVQAAPGSMLLQMKKAVVKATCRRGGCQDGTITGAVTTDQVDTVLVPHLAALFQEILVQDCPGQEPSSCASGSNGQALQQQFDADDDMVITADELRDNELMASVLAPDLDLVRRNGSAGTDGVMDALSFGFAFTTVPATLTRP